MMTLHSNTHADQKFTGRHMALIMVAFFGVIIVVNFTMAFLASKSWTGLIVKNSYLASQQFNEELATAKAQNISGLHSQLSYQDGNLQFILKDRLDNPVRVKNLQIVIGRPAFEHLDQILKPAGDGGTVHTLAVGLLPGSWALKITADADGKPYRRDARIFVNPAGQAGQGSVQ